MRVGSPLLLVILLAGCEPAPPPPVPPTPATAVTGTPTAITASAHPGPKLPPEARRNTAPAGIDESALAVGSTAPALTDVPATTGRWSRTGELTVLVLYRGHW